jgi:hypothetical protein
MLTIPTGELVGTLQDVIPFAATDKELPAINAIRLEWDGDRLHAYATDHYVAGWATWHPDDDPVDPPKEGVQDDLFADWGSGDTGWQATLPLPDVLELVKVYKLPAKVDRIPLEVTVEFPKVTIRRRPADGHSAITTTFEARQGMDGFPDVRTLIGNPEPVPTPTDLLQVDAKRLAAFAKVRYHGPLRLYPPDGAGPVKVRIGDRFTGALQMQRDYTPGNGSAQ